MSSSGRFQSRFFNVVSHQAQKIADQTKKAARHLKVATLWGTQILLYPIYVLFQSTRLIGQQIGRTVQRSLLRLRLSNVIPQLSDPSPIADLTVDTPIQRVLTAIQDSWLLAGATSSHLAKLDRDRSLIVSVAGSAVTIQGIASLISTGKLVLVTIENQVMDVLTIEQQTHLKQRIIWEMANYWRYWRRHYIAPTRSLRLLPLEDRPTLLPPVRVFRQLMAWVQSGPIAVAANLFQESDLTVEPAPLDWFSADLTLSEFSPAVLTGNLPTTSNLAKLIQQLPSIVDMESLVWAAIRYFFGERPQRQLDSGIAEIASAANPLWLTSEDVFGTVAALRGATPRSSLSGKSAAVQIEKTFVPLAYLSAQKAHLSARKDSKPPALPFQRNVTIGRSLQNWLKRSIPQSKARPRSRSPLAPIKASPRELVRTTPSRPLARTEDHVQSAISRDREPSPTLQTSTRPTASDYIDTQATPIGYVKSPLTRFLEWLDRGMVWLENQLAALWNLLTRQS